MTEQTTTEGTTTEATTTEATTTETAQAPTWHEQLPDALKGDATLIRYADVGALAQAHIEAHKVAKSKVVVPGDGADEATMNAFFDAIGRPETADKYEISMPQLPVDATDEQRAALSAEYQPFRELAHNIGLLPHQAKALSDFELGRQNAVYAQGEKEIGELRDKLGADYEPKKDRAMAIYAKLFGEGEDALLLADELDRKVGSGRLMRGMMRLAELAGEHMSVQPDKIEGLGVVKDAAAKLSELQASSDWRQKFEAGDTATVNQQHRLLKLAQEQAARPR